MGDDETISQICGTRRKSDCDENRASPAPVSLMAFCAGGSALSFIQSIQGRRREAVLMGAAENVSAATAAVVQVGRHGGRGFIILVGDRRYVELGGGERPPCGSWGPSKRRSAAPLRRLASGSCLAL
jgi:hypothetical protein